MSHQPFQFPGQLPGEQVVQVIRKHPVVYVKIVFAFLMVTILPILIVFRLWFDAYSTATNPNGTLVVILGASVYFLYGMLFAVIAWVNDAFDIFIVTDQRLIDITQTSLLHRSVSSTPLEKIQDATGRVHGFLPTILVYGDLEIQTAAGDASKFFIDRIPDPDSVARDLLHRVKMRRGETTSE